MPKNFRRVVTGHRIEDGKSFIWKDGASPQSLEPMPELILHEIWETGSKASNTGDRDAAIRENSIEPHDPAGTIFRIVEFPPDEIWMAGDVGEGFKEMGSGSAHDDAENNVGHASPRRAIAATVDDDADGHSEATEDAIAAAAADPDANETVRAIWRKWLDGLHDRGAKRKHFTFDDEDSNDSRSSTTTKHLNDDGSEQG